MLICSTEHFVFWYFPYSSPHQRRFHQTHPQQSWNYLSLVLSVLSMFGSHADTLKVLLNAPFCTSHNLTSSRTSLADFLHTISAKSDAFNKWRLFLLVETKVVVGRGEKTSKVVVRNWARRHTGDKAWVNKFFGLLYQMPTWPPYPAPLDMHTTI